MDVDVAAALGHAVGDLPDGQVGPDQLLVGGAAGGVVAEDVAEVLLDLGLLVDAPLPAAAGAADARLGPVGEPGLEVAAPLADGVGGDVEEPGDVLDAPMAELGGLDGGVAAAIMLAERPAEGLHRLFDLGRVGRHGDHPGQGPGEGETWHCLTTSTRTGIGPRVRKLLTQRSPGRSRPKGGWRDPRGAVRRAPS